MGMMRLDLSKLIGLKELKLELWEMINLQEGISWQQATVKFLKLNFKRSTKEELSNFEKPFTLTKLNLQFGDVKWWLQWVAIDFVDKRTSLVDFIAVDRQCIALAFGLARDGASRASLFKAWW
ncbi:hypothetical protein V6N13_083359 [Hibiscus sabdariffa]